MTDAVDTATTTASGNESATSEAVTTEQQTAATEQGQQQAQQTQQEKQEQQAAAPVVPEAYSFSNLPDGYSISDEQLAAFSPVLKELGLTQEQADKLVAFDVQRSLAAQEASQQQAVEFRNKQVGEWETALRSDADFGGANFEANVAVAQQFLTDFGSPELSAFLAESGLGSHPEVVRMFHKAGKELGEGKLHRTSTEIPKAEMTIVDAFK
ncbi:hypothetical protein LU674_011240 [Pseudomonas alloputida]|uniref:Peptidase n=1 Tax=Pseudomonas alloputida TaxID=1940621 RepID=A0AAW7HI00_9PSED|nr:MULTISPECIES: hypothetical protein [Pseudomonas]MDM3952900.1 hypothetical protein [Pseudomonas alloputida]UJW20785.1 hypothetical protein L2Y89_17650 [Pseudomonas juntendi]